MVKIGLKGVGEASRHWFSFLQRVSIACARISYRKSVRPSVRPSHAGTVSKWLKLRSWGLHCSIAPWRWRLWKLVCKISHCDG